MTDHPSTFRGPEESGGQIDWDDAASVHRTDDGQGLLDGMKALHHGTFAEMVKLVSEMGEDHRSDYLVQKAGDRAYSAAEIMQLVKRPDFPA